MAYNQLLNGVQLDHLVVTNGTTAGVDMTGFRSVAFAVNLSTASGVANMTLEQSPDNTTWSAVPPGYYSNTTSPYPTPDATGVTANGTVGAANRFLVIEFNRPGRETSVPAVTATPSSSEYLRVNVTSGTVGYALALKSNPMWEPVTQPDVTARTVASN